MTKKLPHFIVIDDDPISNLICEVIITKTFPTADVMTFTKPETGLIYLKSAFNKPGDRSILLFLDINMPTMTGWEFMEQYERTFPIAQDRISVYILSSTVYPKDFEKAKVNPHIIEFIEKPLNEKKLLKIIG